MAGPQKPCRGRAPQEGRQRRPLKLHLGCGQTYLPRQEGWLNLDADPASKADRLVDLEKPLPFPDNSVDAVTTAHTLEHVANLDGLLREIHRVCRPGAPVHIVVPHYQSEGAYWNTDHKRFFTPNSFKKWRDYFVVKKVRLYPDLFSKPMLTDPLGTLATLVRRRLGLWHRKSAIIFDLEVKKPLSLQRRFSERKRMGAWRERDGEPCPPRV